MSNFTEIKMAVKEAMLEVFVHAFNKSDAAQLIGISRTTLYSHINEGDITPTPEGKITMYDILKIKKQHS